MEPILVVMAAGMGSRYGGNKQLDRISKEGDIIMDFSLYDAYEAGFRRVCFIIKHDFEEVFREHIKSGAGKSMKPTTLFRSSMIFRRAMLCLREGLNHGAQVRQYWPRAIS